ncbi:MAG: TonB-dependent receptor [candidate division KSB1 bacterium]|nr:TonB-dependent receptor [candidate division KSB1 bacterium]
MPHRSFIRVVLAVVLLSGTLLFSGTTGKIAGRVVDKTTGEPLPGVNVTVSGTTLGAATDLNGYYTILQVPPGLYTLHASAIGYGRMAVQDVRVLIDQTTRIDFALSMEVLAGEEITITAERDIMREDVATSVASISRQEVQQLPVVSVKQVVELNAGIEEGLVIRGGDARQALFQVDGVTLRDPRNNKPITGIALSAVREVSVERGGFNAEYGQVRSGIINIVTQEGRRDAYSGSFTVRYAPPAPKHFGISPFDPMSMWNRPYLDDAVCWTGTESGAWDKYTQRQYPKFEGWNKISEQLMTDDDPTNDLSPAGAQRDWMWRHRRRPVTDQPDYNVDMGFGGPVPFISKPLGDLRFFAAWRREREMLLYPLSRDDYLEDNFSLQLTSDISSAMKLRVGGIWGKSYNVAINATDNNYYGTTFGISGQPYWNPTDFMRTPLQIARLTAEQRSGRIFSDSWYCPADVSNYAYNVKLSHVLSPKTFYEVSLETVHQGYHTEPIRERDYTRKYEIIPGYFVDEAPMGWSPLPQTGLDGMFFGGHTGTARDYSKSTSLRLKGDLTSQVSFSNQIKTGAEFFYSDLDLHYGEVNYFTSTFNMVQRRNFPISASAYIQDKYETKGFILNAGLRMDYLNSNCEWWDIGPFTKQFYSAKYNPNAEFPKKKAEPEISFSPRLGISHPITANSKLFFNYGHFKQLPTYEQIFRLSRAGSGQVTNIGNPELRMAKTISYELGYDHVLMNTLLLQLAAFYHDISDQQAFTTYIDEVAGINYNMANNNSYEDIRGFEVTLRKSGGRWWSGFANYTYQVSTRGHFGTDRVYASPSQQKDYDRRTQNLYQERPIPRPYARAGLTFFTPKDFGPRVGGLAPAGDWLINLLANWRAGDWVTWNPNGLQHISQNVQVRDEYNFMLRLSKTFHISKMELSLFCEIDNLFNNKFLSGASFYDVNDQIAYFESLHLPKSEAYNNIPGNDRVGDYRRHGAEFQPIEQVGQLETISNPDPKVIYYHSPTGRYMEYADNNWREVDSKRMKKILDDKAYIDMPNQTSFNFLNPRRFFFGIRTSFNLD